jgi:hypothetical protein
MEVSMTRIIVLAMAAIAAAGSASAELYLVPVVAHELPGHGENRWSSELYLSNGGPSEVTVTMGGFLPGRREPLEACETFAPVTRTVPAYSTVLWSGAELGPDIGCATLVLGGLLLDATGPIRIRSRLVNHSGHTPAPHQALHGSAQTVDAIELSSLPDADSYLLGGLLWHRNTCGIEEFVTSVGFANPGDRPVQVTLDLEADVAQVGMRIDGAPVALPFPLEVPAHGWRQIRLTPEDSMLTVCMDPEVFDLVVETTGPLALYGSVVDRLSHDPHTVVAVPRAP